METATRAYHVSKALFEEQVVDKIPSTALRQVFKNNMDSAISFLLMLPIQLTLIFCFLNGFGKLADRNFVVVLFVQILLALAFGVQVALRTLFDIVFCDED